MNQRDASRALRRAHRIVVASICASLSKGRLRWDTRSDARPELVPVPGALDESRLFFVRHEETSEGADRTCAAVVYANAECARAHLRQSETLGRLVARLGERGYDVAASDPQGWGGVFELHVIARSDGARMGAHDHDEILSAFVSVDENGRRPALRLV